MGDIVFKSDGEWWWYDEAYNEYGPYETEEEAGAAWAEYCEKVLGR